MAARLARACFPLLCSALLGACGGTQTLETAQGPCVEGQSARCDCADGSLGVQLCGSDSQFGACDCPSAASGTNGGGGTTAGVGGEAGTTGGAAGMSTNPTAGTGAGGSGGSPFSGGVGGISGMTGGVPATGGSGGMSGGSGGMTGGAPATGGSGGFAGMSGGSGGSGGFAGMSGGSGGDSGPGRNPRPGELYGDCLATGACNDGLLCISDGSSGVPMSYCTTTCGGIDAMRCPRSRDDRMAICVLGICVR